MFLALVIDSSVFFFLGSVWDSLSLAFLLNYSFTSQCCMFPYTFSIISYIYLLIYLCVCVSHAFITSLHKRDIEGCKLFIWTEKGEKAKTKHYRRWRSSQLEEHLHALLAVCCVVLVLLKLYQWTAAVVTASTIHPHGIDLFGGELLVAQAERNGGST